MAAPGRAPVRLEIGVRRVVVRLAVCWWLGVLAGPVIMTAAGTTTTTSSSSSSFTSASGTSPNAQHWLQKREKPEVPDEQRLLNKLLNNYHMYSRPVFNASEKVVIKFGLTLVQISDMDEVNQVLTINVWLEQEWQDERLTWDPKDFNGLTILRIPCEKIWLPDIVLYNSADDFTTGYMKSKAMVSNTGNVFWPPPAKFRSSCKIDITYFPFDDQVCELKFGSWTYDGFQVDITNRSAKVDLTNYVFSGEWELIDVRVRRTEMYYACCSEPYPDVRFTIIIRRKTLYYLFNIIFPCLWLTILSLLGFWLPPDSGEKITLGITVLLAFSVFMLLIAESMPATSEFVPLIGIYLTVTMAMTSLSIILTVFVLQLHHVGPHQKRVPRWMWTLVLDILAPIVCLCHVNQRYRYLSARLNKTAPPPPSGDPPAAAPAKTGREFIGLNTLGPGDTTSSSLASSGGGGGSRGRGNCNGIVMTGGSWAGRVGGGGVAPASRGEAGSYHSEALHSDGGSSCRKERPRSEGATLSSRGSGSYVAASLASSSSQAQTAAAAVTSHNNDEHSRGHNHHQQQQPADRSSSRDSGTRAQQQPARRDPRWRPAEYVNCRAVGSSQGSVDSPQHRAVPPSAAAPDGSVLRRDVVRQGAATTTGHRDRDAFPETVALPTVSPPACSTTPSTADDATAAKLRMCETSLDSKDAGRSTPDPHEKLLPPRPTSAGSSGRPQGQAPPAYQSTYVQHSTPEAVVRDYYVISGSPSRDRQPTVTRPGRGGGGGGEGRGDFEKDQIAQHLEVLVHRDDEDDYHQDVVTEWRVVAHVMDRLLFWLFLLVAILSSVIILIVKPLTKPEKWRQEE
ncbi:uncharacterized protein LOC143282052 [Babylonia areolata]|uniref:uncharacterized protein LOC143282052 n=1 Tax=Babylonia areolata TaxID=304850 RepID=UPI003FD399BD